MATPMSQEDINFLRLAGLLIKIAPCAVRQKFDCEFNPVRLQEFLNKNRSKIDRLKTKERVITQVQLDSLYPKGHTKTAPDLRSEVDVLMGLPLTNVEEIIHFVRLEKELEKLKQHLHATNRKLETLEIESRNIAEIRLEIVKEWKDTDKKYVSTSAVTFIQETLQHNMAVIITGPPGCGKSFVAHHIALELEDRGFDLIPCDEPSEIIKNFTTVKMQAFIFDDVCGKFALNQYDADSWEKNNGNLDKLIVSCKKDDNVSKCSAKFIFICRENIFTHKAFPTLTCFSPVQCSFSTNYRITQDEMRKIALSYISDVTLTKIKNIYLYDFFPLSCALYREERHSAHTFFIHPVEIIEKEISQMKIKSEPSFLCLSLLVLKNNKCSKAELISGELEELSKKVCREGEIESIVSPVSLQQSFELFKGIYISESDNSYTAIHDKMFDIISAAIAPSIMECFIENVDIAFLANRTQLASFGKNSLPFIIYIPEQFESLYLQRQYKAVVEGKYWEVFGSQQTGNEDYRNLLLSFLKDQDTSQPIVYAADVDGATPLFVSSSLGYMNFVRYFSVKCCDDKNAKDKKGRSSLYIACANGHISTVEYLLHFCVDTALKDTAGLSALHAACRSGRTEIVKLLIEVGMNINDTTEQGLPPLHLACKSGCIETVKFLIDMNQPTMNLSVDTTIKDADGNTALHHACSYGDVNVVLLLIEAGLDITSKENRGLTPFMKACIHGHFNIVQFLLRKFENALPNITGMTLKDNGQCDLPLHAACYAGNIKLIQLLMNVGIDVNSQTRNGATPLFLACVAGHFDTVMFLLDLKDHILNSRVDIFSKDSVGWTALHKACYNGHTNIVKILIDAGLNENDKTNKGDTPLCLACVAGHFDTVMFLLDLKDQILNSRVDIFSKDSFGWTALHKACCNGHTNIVKILIDAGLNENDKTKQEDTPLCLACVAGHFDTVMFLLELKDQSFNSRVDLLATNSVGYTVLHSACVSGSRDIVKILIDAGLNVNDATKDGYTALFCACAKGRYDTVKFLLDLNAKTLSCPVDLISKDSNGYTAFHASCYNGHKEVVHLLCDAGMNVNDTTNDGSSPLLLACREGHYDTVKFLLTLNGETPNMHVDSILRDSRGMTALHAACCRGHTEIVKILIDVGINVNDKTIEGLTPLYLACLRGHFDTVKLLLNYTDQSLKNLVDFTIKDLHGRTALHLSCVNGHAEVVKILIEAGMNVNDTTNDGSTPLLLACREGHYDTVKFLLTLNGETPNIHVDSILKDSSGMTALHKACCRGHTEIVKMLIDFGINVNDKTIEGLPPLYLACRRGHFDTVKLLLSYKDQSLNNLVDFTITDLHGWTVLHLSCLNGHAEVVKILIDAGMNVNEKTSEVLTPLHLACFRGHFDTVQFLIDSDDYIFNSRIDSTITSLHGLTALHSTCMNGHVEVVKMLINAGMNVNEQTKEGFTPLHLACGSGHNVIDHSSRFFLRSNTPRRSGLVK